MGNHEEMLLEALERVEVLRHFVTYGGKETILSLGVPRPPMPRPPGTNCRPCWGRPSAGMAGFRAAFRDAGAHRRLCLRPCRRAARHARWRRDCQGSALDREPFLSSTADHGAVVVHGHTISDEPVQRSNRIGIDTGAYASGRLTALVLEGTQRWYLTASEVEGAITTHLAPLPDLTIWAFCGFDRRICKALALEC
jgi:serine/threonine protein phosphatase 1